jgi:hypothetical protein
MKRRNLMIGASALFAIGGWRTAESGTSLKAETFAGGVLRVKYPTDGNKDILIFVNPDGSVAGAKGGTKKIKSFSITEQRLSFVAKAVTNWGYKKMSFNLIKAADGGGYSGDYNISSCKNNCTRTGTATWDSGREKVAIPAG